MGTLKPRGRDGAMRAISLRLLTSSLLRRSLSLCLCLCLCLSVCLSACLPVSPSSPPLSLVLRYGAAMLTPPPRAKVDTGTGQPATLQSLGYFYVNPSSSWDEFNRSASGELVSTVVSCGQI